MIIVHPRRTKRIGVTGIRFDIHVACRQMRVEEAT